MRNLLLVAASAFLSACVTVSVVPVASESADHEAISTSSIETASARFCDTTIDRGWITQSPGLAEMARVLVDGRGEAEDAPSMTYARSLSRDIAGGADGYQKLAADAEDAREILSDVTNEVRAVLSAQADDLRREDITSYERALVHAQKSRRSFAEAAEFIGQLQSANVPSSVEMVLTSYDAEIDRARHTADELAERYTNGARAATS